MAMRVSVFGAGYVGSVTAACLARAGHKVVAVDVNPQKVDMINAGTSPVVEQGLGELLAHVVGAGRLRATTSGAEAIDHSDLALICVGTPGRPNGRLDVDAVAGVAREIGRALRGRRRPFTVVLRSTVLPGTTEEVLVPALRSGLGEAKAPPPLSVAVNPEFMREGSSLEDFARPPLTLVGSADAEAASLLQALYAGVEAPFVHTTVRTAEMAKYVANAFHALKVCFANEIADVCDALGADAQQVMQVFLMDRKLSVSEAYLRPGFAFGGSCLPKDVRALLYGARSADVLPPLLGAILPSNEAQVRRGVEAVLAAGKRRVGVVGLSFKDGTDDLRESPLVTLVESLIGKGCDVSILDRSVSLARLVGANRRYIEEQIPHIASLMCDDLEALLEHAEVLVIGNAGEDAVKALAAIRPDQVLVDLTRGRLDARGRARPTAEPDATAAANASVPALTAAVAGLVPAVP
ncbi:MAG TPA: nucleotide sugar dehydrogenase [Vicinamibacteria bacterium]|jgi:GDP-mannose 6-dehydrogenase